MRLHPATAALALTLLLGPALAGCGTDDVTNAVKPAATSIAGAADAAAKAAAKAAAAAKRAEKAQKSFCAAYADFDPSSSTIPQALVRDGLPPGVPAAVEKGFAALVRSQNTGNPLSAADQKKVDAFVKYGDVTCG